MSALLLFDFAFSAGQAADAAPQQHADRLARLAEQLVAASLGELAAVSGLDASLAPRGPGEFDRQAAVLLRGMYEQWSRDADAVIERAGRVARLGRDVPRLTELRDEQGRVLAMLKSSIEDIEQARRQVRAGPTFTTREVRDALRAGVR
jgi:hypothetical protein